MIRSREGRKINMLTVIEKVSGEGSGKYLCQCDCGGTKIIAWEHLRRGVTKSCGCLRGEVALAEERHHSRVGAQIHPLYQIWRGMLRRCYDTKHQAYGLYGAKGIRVCDAWRVDFFAFADHMGERPEGKTVDRFPNMAGNYEPGNVRWATPQEQTTNSSVGLAVLLNGEKVTSAEAARRIQVSYNSVAKARKHGFPPAQALALAKIRSKAADKQAQGVAIDWDRLKDLIPEAMARLRLEAI